MSICASLCLWLEQTLQGGNAAQFSLGNVPRFCLFSDSSNRQTTTTVCCGQKRRQLHPFLWDIKNSFCPSAWRISSHCFVSVIFYLLETTVLVQLCARWRLLLYLSISVTLLHLTLRVNRGCELLPSLQHCQSVNRTKRKNQLSALFYPGIRSKLPTNF